MAESMPVEAKRQSALETTSVTCKTLEVFAASVREFCDWSGLLADSNVEALEVDRLLTEFMNPPGVERRTTVGKRVSAFFETTAPGGSLERSGRGNVQARWYLAAVLTLVMLEAYLRLGEMLSLRHSSFLAPTEGGVRSWVILLFPQTGTARSKTGEADDTISLDSKRCLWMRPVFERLQRRQPQDKPLLFRRAAAHLQVDMVPYQGRHSGASVDRAENLRTSESIQKRGRWKSAKSVRRYEKADVPTKVGQSSLHWSRHTASNNLLPSGIAASPTPPRISSAQAPISKGFS